jgi:hypothetical protein
MPVLRTHPSSRPDVRPRGPARAHTAPARRRATLGDARLATAADTGPLPPPWGWKIPDAGRAGGVMAGPEYQATTTQLCGLYPFVAGSGTPTAGTPVGRHQLWGEVVCLDPLAWLRAGLVTNPGMFVLGQPGTGKSALVKRLVTGAVCVGTRVLVLGDTKPDYARLVRYLGGQVIRIGRGLDTINPLDIGPLGTALAQLTGTEAERLREEVRSRRLALLLALATLVREARIGNAEEVLLGRAIDLLDERLARTRQPTVTDVLQVIEQGPDTLRAAARADTPQLYRKVAAELVFTLDLLCTGSLARVFDRATSQPIDLDAPAVSVDISAVKAAGDKLLTAALLVHLELRLRLRRRGRRTRRSRNRPAALLPGGAGRAVARPARRPRPGRARRRPHPAEPGQSHGPHHDHPLARRPRRPGHPRRPGQGPRLRRPVRHHRAGRPAAARARAGGRDHPAHRPRTRPGRLLVGARFVAARRPPPRPRQIPHQNRRAARHPGPAHPGRPRTRPV